jgi:glycerol-3-phosphate dehydrogenase
MKSLRAGGSGKANATAALCAIKDLSQDWNLVVVGGGITGAGVFQQAVRMGLKVLLVEQNDYASGTSSRSSKLVHGGLRYLKEGRFFLTRDAVKQRERLLKEAPGLVTPLTFLVPVYKEHGPGKWALEAGLAIYDLIAKKRQHQFYNPSEFVACVPAIEQKGLIGGFQFVDAQVDDARLVLRLITDGIRQGGQALNYTQVVAVNRDREGKVSGVTIRDAQSGRTLALHTPAVINATGCWAEFLHPSPKPQLHIRPLRGSHIIFPASKIPISQAVSFIHPRDQRALFLLPWEGAVILGTTDLDHPYSLSREPVITSDEVAYLMEGLNTLFPSLALSAKACLSTMAGVRPVLSQGNRDPSQESREHAVWVDHGLITVTGGKLTTFGLLAADALKAAKPFLSADWNSIPEAVLFGEPLPFQEAPHPLSAAQWQCLCGRYGEAALEIVHNADPRDLEMVPGTRTLWAEFAYAARHEQVRCLGDLMLRRLRVGLLTPHGGREHLGRIRRLCEPALTWGRRRWRREIREYLDHWQMAHGLPSSRPRGRLHSWWRRWRDGVANLAANWR